VFVSDRLWSSQQSLLIAEFNVVGLISPPPEKTNPVSADPRHILSNASMMLPPCQKVSLGEAEIGDSGLSTQWPTYPQNNFTRGGFSPADARMLATLNALNRPASIILLSPRAYQ
jgi:hypothetical protein